MLYLSNSIGGAKAGNYYLGLTGKTPPVMNVAKNSSIRGWDFTFSAPQSVCVLCSQLPTNQRNRIEAAHRSAVNTALRFLEMKQ
jgi:hypothetical protein